MTGRPSLCTEAIASELCERLCNGQSLNAICRDEHMPTRKVVHEWVADDRNGFRDKYARARDLQIDFWVDQIIDIADAAGDCENHALVQAARLRVDARKWIASKLAPKKYGDRTELVGAGGKDFIPEHATDPGRVTQALLLALRAQPEPKNSREQGCRFAEGDNHQ
jgi:hypothetical protein